jgi:hypothetical protein
MQGFEDRSGGANMSVVSLSGSQIIMRFSDEALVPWSDNGATVGAFDGFFDDDDMSVEVGIREF